MKVELIQEYLTIPRGSILLNNKLVTFPFFTVGMQSKTDLDLLCDLIGMGGDLMKFTNSIQAVSYRVFEHDKVVRHREYNLKQYNLNLNIVDKSYAQVNNAIKFVDPATDVFRLNYSKYIDEYLTIDKNIPKYFQVYLKQIKENSEKDKKEREDYDLLHIRFWKGLFENSGRINVGHFIKWSEYLQKERKADIFIAPTPYIKQESCEFLLEKAIDINRKSHDLVTGDVADSFFIDAGIFQNKKLIERLVDYLGITPSEMILFKINGYENLVNRVYGSYALKNFKFLLNTIKTDYRYFKNKVRSYGLLNGGGFGYCLLGGGFDFFTDTVSSFEYYPSHPPKRRSTHRGTIGAESLVYEKFESLKNLFDDYGETPLPYHPQKKYDNIKQLYPLQINSKEWARDCKLNSMCLWNAYVNDNINGMINKDDRLVFDRISNSAFTQLSPIIKDLNSY
ncbi:hypothetical protein BEH94_08440 [Candidatus Altiarchaeales archaeon WOR_SM1_SCG]|nr:hypothetical protein BEH94_08440 [Candidatus Altiarchaeales archaeon WOR_SM1_SCG]